MASMEMDRTSFNSKAKFLFCAISTNVATALGFDAAATTTTTTIQARAANATTTTPAAATTTPARAVTTAPAVGINNRSSG